MATYDSLSPEQKVLMAEIERQTRAFLGGLSRLIVQARALDAAWATSNGGDAILALLDPAEVIPNSSGIAGAHDLTQAEWSVMRTAGLADFLTTYDNDAVRRVLAKAFGPTAGL